MVFRCDEVLLSYNKYNETKDQWECVSTHTQKGISFLETFTHFIKDRCQVELDYARCLRRLVQKYQPKKKEEDEQFTTVKAFRDSLSETADLAGQHEVIAENLSTYVAQETYNLIKELKEERKKHLLEGNRLQQQLTQSLQQLEKAKKNYEKAFKESDKAQENYKKADEDLHLSRAEVEKQRMNASIRSLQAEDHKNEYANQLQKTNTLQVQHYTTLMPTVFLQLQELDESRIDSFRSLLKKTVDVERGVFPIINRCLEGIVEAADRIDQHKDSQLVIEKYKSGFTPPGDIPFDDLSTPRPNGDAGTPTAHPPSRSDTMKGTISTSKLKKRVGIFGIFASNKANHSFNEKDDFNDLPPTQRRKKIQHRIDEVQAKLNQEIAARDGLLKMKEVYTANASLGNPQTITGQLNDSCQTIEKLKAEIEKFQAMLEESETNSGGTASGGSNTPTSNSLGRHASNITANGNTSSPRSSMASHSQRTSLSEESLSSSSHSPESGIGLSRTSLTGQDSVKETRYDNVHGANNASIQHNTYDIPDAATLAEEEEFYEAELLPIIGSCQALYHFDATSEGSMAMGEGEILYLIEEDQGDGWTRVRRKDVFEEGFVPTTYIQITLDNNC